MLNLECVKVFGDIYPVSYCMDYADTLVNQIQHELDEGRSFYPEIRSWAGLESWQKRLAPHMDVDERRMRLIVRLPAKEDHAWVHTAPIDKVEELLYPSPFGTIGTLEEPMETSASFAKDATGWFWNLWVSASAYRGLGVRSWRTAKRYIELFNGEETFALECLQDRRLPTDARWLSDRALVERCLGIVIPAAAIAKFGLPMILRDRNIFKAVDFNYLPMAEMEAPYLVSDFYKAGVPYAEMYALDLEEFTKSGVLGKKDVHKALSNVEYLGEYRTRIKNYLICQMASKMGIDPEELPTWMQLYAVDDTSAAWALRHMEQLSKTRLIAAERGETATWHYHTLLRHVNHDVLGGNPNLGWKRSMEVLDEIMAREIADLSKEDRELPLLPPLMSGAPEFPGIKQITTTHGLRDEGEEMEHCAGGYIRNCDARRSYVLHMEDGTLDGATIELNPPSWDDDAWFVNQAMNKGNRHSPIAKQMAEEYASWLPTKY